jgi:hypothetical protein
MKKGTDDSSSRIRLGHKVEVIVASLIAAFIIISMWSHVPMAWDIARGHRPSMLRFQLGFPVVTMYEGGATIPGSTTAISGAVPLQPGGGTGGFEIDISIVCNEGEECVCLLGKVVPLPRIMCIIAGVLFICYLLAVVIDTILQWICSSKWVQEPVSYETCQERSCAWWDVWCWANKIWCYIETTFRWVLQQVCAWRTALVWGTGIACAISGIVIIVAVMV